MEFLTPPSGVCILIYSRNRHQPFCASLGTQSSECGARTGHSRKNQKSGCLASPCRHARKATVFANFGDSWLASSSCTQAQPIFCGAFFAMWMFQIMGSEPPGAYWCCLILFDCIHMSYVFIPCLFFVLGLAKQNHPPVLLQMFCLFNGTSSVKGQFLNCSRLTFFWLRWHAALSRTMHPFFAAWIWKSETPSIFKWSICLRSIEWSDKKEAPADAADMPSSP